MKLEMCFWLVRCAVQWERLHTLSCTCAFFSKWQSVFGNESFHTIDCTGSVKLTVQLNIMTSLCIWSSFRVLKLTPVSFDQFHTGCNESDSIHWPVWSPFCAIKLTTCYWSVWYRLQWERLYTRACLISVLCNNVDHMFLISLMWRSRRTPPHANLHLCFFI